MAYTQKTRIFLVVLLVICWGVVLIKLRKPEQMYHDNRMLMGTFWEVSSSHKEASAIVFAEALRIEQLLSKYIATSEISQLNRAGRLKVSADTFYIIKKSKEFWQLSNGAFDITVGPLLTLWGFNSQAYIKPEDEKIQTTLALIGSDKILLHEKNNVVEFKLPGMGIDLGGIAKGFALDCAVKKLREKNISNCLINAGGQVYALGENFGKPWKVAIKNPRKPEITEMLKLKNQSVSTSGDYEQFFLKDGKRYCHIMNPKTGYPATSGIISVSVISPSGLTADALSTAIFILGKDRGRDLAKQFKNTEIKISE